MDIFDCEHVAVSHPLSWTMLKAKLFGVKTIQRDDIFTVVGYFYKGVFYITKFNEDRQ